MMRDCFAKLLLLSLACGTGCGNDGHSHPQDAGTDAPPSCSSHPTTHEEIINACTTAQKIYKDTHPALLHADGSLPPLP